MGGNWMLSFSSVLQNCFLGGEGAGQLRKYQRREQPIRRKTKTIPCNGNPGEDQNWVGMAASTPHAHSQNSLLALTMAFMGFFFRVRTLSGREGSRTKPDTLVWHTHSLSSSFKFRFSFWGTERGESGSKVWNVLTIFFPNAFKLRKEKLTSLF